MGSKSKKSELTSPWPHRLAVVLCWTVFPLIWVGGLVTTYDAGMAVPDWPSTYGYNLFLYPYTTWIFGPWDLFLEHGHRLLGALAGLLTIVFLLAVYYFDPRRWMLKAAIWALVLVILQGCLGGFRVILDDRQLAMLHGCAGPIFFAYCVSMAVFTSQAWRAGERRAHPRARFWQRVAISTTVFAYVQLVLGAFLRHIPVTATPWVFNISLILHLANAGILLVHIVLISLTFSRYRHERLLRWSALQLILLYVIQLVLGVSNWVVTYGWPNWFVGYRFWAAYTIEANSLWQTTTVTAHMATGSLVLVAALHLTLRSLRLLDAKGDPAA
jgi:cytochrome c oxidase assembly protein subunit 15